MTTTNKLTNKVALAAAAALMNGHTMDEVTAAAGYSQKELAAHLTHMYEVASKPRAKGTKSPSKESLALVALAKEAGALVAAQSEPVGTNWVMEHVAGVTSSQKATAVMRKAMELGLVEKAAPVKGKVQYQGTLAE